MLSNRNRYKNLMTGVDFMVSLVRRVRVLSNVRSFIPNSASRAPFQAFGPYKDWTAETAAVRKGVLKFFRTTGPFDRRFARNSTFSCRTFSCVLPNDKAATHSSHPKARMPAALSDETCLWSELRRCEPVPAGKPVPINRLTVVKHVVSLCLTLWPVFLAACLKRRYLPTKHCFIWLVRRWFLKTKNV